MANTSQLTIVTGLPKFSGNPRIREPHFKSDITAKHFLEALENRFAISNISTDAEKLNIFYSMIDHTRGDALTLIPCFKGANVHLFSEVKEQFLDFYDKDKQTEFQPAAKLFMKIDLRDDLAGNLTQLNNLAEAYVTSDQFLGTDYNVQTVLANPTQTGGGTNEGQPNSAVSYKIGAGEPIDIVRVLQNLLMHTVIAAQTHKKVAEKVKKYGPSTPSTKLMTSTNKIVSDYPLTDTDKAIAKQEDVVWKASTNMNNNTRSVQRESSQYTRTNKPTQTTKAHNRGDGRLRCFNCNEAGHTRRECRTCAFCKKGGHTARLCEARIKKAKGKFCNNCQLKDSHDTHECYRGERRPTRIRPRDVRVIREYPDTEVPTYNGEWAPNNYDYVNDRQGKQPPQT